MGAQVADVHRDTRWVHALGFHIVAQQPPIHTQKGEECCDGGVELVEPLACSVCLRHFDGVQERGAVMLLGLLRE